MLSSDPCPDWQTPVASPGFAGVRAPSVCLELPRGEGESPVFPELPQALSLMLAAFPAHLLKALTVPGTGHP